MPLSPHSNIASFLGGKVSRGRGNRRYNRCMVNVVNQRLSLNSLKFEPLPSRESRAGVVSYCMLHTIHLLGNGDADRFLQRP
jgi:hypothetical protein